MSYFEQLAVDLAGSAIGRWPRKLLNQTSHHELYTICFSVGFSSVYGCYTLDGYADDTDKCSTIITKGYNLKNTKETCVYCKSNEKQPVLSSQSLFGLLLAVPKRVVIEGLPKLTLRFFDLALEALLELPRIRHRTQDPSPRWGMWVGVDAVDCSVFARLTTPPVAVTDEKHLLLCEVI